MVCTSIGTSMKCSTMLQIISCDFEHNTYNTYSKLAHIVLSSYSLFRHLAMPYRQWARKLHYPPIWCIQDHQRATTSIHISQSWLAHRHRHRRRRRLAWALDRHQDRADMVPVVSKDKCKLKRHWVYVIKWITENYKIKWCSINVGTIKLISSSQNM